MTEVPLLRVENLNKRFGQLAVIDDLTFQVASGETFGIVGPNGAGKSTLLNLIGGVAAADSGRIYFASSDVTRVSAPGRCHRGISRSYQIPRPFADITVFENTLVAATHGARASSREASGLAVSALERTGLLPHANQPAGSLRLLDRKRLELARALACRPRLVLLDEVAGGLTEPEIPALVKTVRALKDDGVGVVWIEHVVHALLAVVDRMMCLTYGRLLAIGRPDEVMNNADVREVYLGSLPQEASP